MKKRIIVLLTAAILILAVFMQTVFAVPPSNPHIDSGTADEGGRFFQYYADGVYSDLKTPPHYVVETGEVAYCLEHNLESADGELYHTFDAVSLYSSKTYNGLLAILMNGYPYTNAGLTNQQARYATANAIRSWLAESAGIGYRFMVPEYDLLRYKSGYYAVWAFYKQLLVYARDGSSSFVQYSVYTNPRTVTLTEQGGELKGAIVVNMQNCYNYTIDESKLPAGITLSGYTGNNGDILTVTAPLNYSGDTITLDKVFVGNINRASSSFFWLDASASGTQSVVVTAVDSFTPAAYASLTFTSEGPAEGYIEIYKTDESTGLPLEGAVFQILDSDNNEAGQLSTNAEGYAVSELLEEGIYSVKEITAPYGYVINDTAVENIEVIAEQTTTLNLNNSAQTGTLHIVKNDIETGSIPQGDAALNGAVFEIYDSNDLLVEILDCGDSSSAASPELPLGTYTIKETTAPIGYTLDETLQTVSIEYTDQSAKTNTINVTVSNEVIKGSIEIQKTVDVPLAEWTADNEEYPLAGIEFNIVHKATGILAETLITDNTGFAQSSSLPYGTYTITEISFLYGYLICEPFDVTISENDKTYELTVENQAVKSNVRLIKTDADTGNTIQTAGTQFHIRDINNALVIMNGQSIFTTDGTGTVLLPEPLPFGEYTLHEITPPYGYWLDNNPVSFSIGGSKDETVTIEFSDSKILKNIAVTKTDERDSSRKLEGVVFNIYKDDILVDSITTDSDGTAVSKALPAGDYTIKEVQAPTGFILDDNSYSVSITDDETMVYTFSFINSPTEVTMNKTDSVNGNPVEDSDIGIYDSEGTLISSGTTDINGQITFTELPAGDYTYKETNAPKGYILNTNSYAFSIDEYGNIAGETEFTNDPTAVKIIKVIYETNEPLSGAGFIVKGTLGLSTYNFRQNDDGTYHYDKDGDTQEIIVDENGEALIYGLPSDSYWLEESIVPSGYYPCAPTKFIVDETQSTDAPLEIIIPNSEYVNLGLDRDKWYLPIAISLVGLLSFVVILFLVFRKRKI